jgi:hypothetical protein
MIRVKRGKSFSSHGFSSLLDKEYAYFCQDQYGGEGQWVMGDGDGLKRLWTNGGIFDRVNQNTGFMNSLWPL